MSFPIKFQNPDDNAKTNYNRQNMFFNFINWLFLEIRPLIQTYSHWFFEDISYVSTTWQVFAVTAKDW